MYRECCKGVGKYVQSSVCLRLDKHGAETSQLKRHHRSDLHESSKNRAGFQSLLKLRALVSKPTLYWL